MAVRFSCPCGQKLKTADGTVGKRAKCPKCEKWIRVPQSDSYETVGEFVDPELRTEQKVSAALRALEKMKAIEAREKPAAPSSAPERPPEADSSFGAKAKVLVADADAEGLKAKVALLRDHGYYIIEVADGAEAVDAIRRRKPDAALLDVQLPGMSGFQVVKQIRDPANPLNKEVWNMPILMTASRVRGRDKQYAISIGTQGYFAKPLNPAQVCSKLEKEIAKYREIQATT